MILRATAIGRELRAALPKEQVFPRTRAERALFMVILALGIFLRTAGIDWGLSPRGPYNPPIHDEVHAMFYLQLPWASFAKEFGDYEFVQGVIFTRYFFGPLVWLGERFGWNRPDHYAYEYVAARAPSALFGILGLLAVYVLATLLGGSRTGLAALALLTVLPGHWYYSQMIKNEMAVATLATLATIVAIFVVERGHPFWYVVGGALAGVATAAKISAAPLFPLLGLAHLLRVGRERSWRALLDRRLGSALLLAGVAFLVFSPFPLLNPSRWWSLFAAHPDYRVEEVSLADPRTFLLVWQRYNGPGRALMEMMFGEAIRRVIPLTALLVLLAAGWAFRRSSPLRWRFLLTGVAGLFFYLGLSLFAPITDRYVLLIVPFVVTGVAVMTTAAWPALAEVPRAVRAALAIAGILLLAYTAGVTAVLFPPFALGPEPRETVAKTLEARVGLKEVVGEFEPGGRQSLPFDRSRMRLAPLRSGGGRFDAHVYRYTNPQFLIVQRPPENTEHDFRRHLRTPEQQADFAALLSDYTPVETFGREPAFFGRLLPRKISHPVYDLYRKRERPDRRGGRDLLAERGELARPLLVSRPALRLAARALTRAELTDGLLVAEFDLRALKEAWTGRADARVIGGLVVAFGGEPRPSDLLSPVEEFTFVTKDSAWALALPITGELLERADALSFALDVRPDGTVDIYQGTDGILFGQTLGGPKEFRSLRVGIAVLPTREDVSLPGTVYLTKLALERR